MKADQKLSKLDKNCWSWPVDPQCYDQTHQLSLIESSVLESYLSESNTSRQTVSIHIHSDLTRLRQPIHAALDVTGAERRSRRSVVRFLLSEMYHRHTTFWAWRSTDWITLLHNDSEALRSPNILPGDCRQHLIAIAYLLCKFVAIDELGPLSRASLANKVFRCDLLECALQKVLPILIQWGYSERRMSRSMTKAIYEVLLLNRSPYLEDLTYEVLQEIYSRKILKEFQDNVWLLSRALASLGLIEKSVVIPSNKPTRYGDEGATFGIPEVWVSWCQRWHDTSTLAPRTRETIHYNLLKAGQWIAWENPEAANPESWTRETAALYVAAVDRMTVGQWKNSRNLAANRVGKPLTPRTKDHHLCAIRTFFRDGYNWGWFPRRFDPLRSLATPRSIRALIGPNPRIIADDIWAKLLWAGLNLTLDDLPKAGYKPGRTHPEERTPWYPMEMVQALSIIWLFAGLRSDEIWRLRLGCVRWHRKDVSEVPPQISAHQNAVCFLDIPINKTGRAFTKPVDRVIGDAIEAWELVRPKQPSACDPKTGEIVQFLFTYRGRRVGRDYLNRTIIPMLCRKAGVPERDARGPLTSHRARSTIASQLFNAKEAMSLFELQEWLGHRSAVSTQHYVKITPTKLAKAYADADYFKRNVRAIEVLLDQDAIKSGSVMNGEPWKFYDLGHGYCSYDFFDQCPHRMACAKCSFYIPKESSKSQLLESKINLQKMLQVISLSEDEQAAVEEGINAIENLRAKLADVPTPEGPTPRHLEKSINSQHLETISQIEIQPLLTHAQT